MTAPVVIVQASLHFAEALLADAALSFLGLVRQRSAAAPRVPAVRRRGAPDDGAGLHFVGTELAHVVTSRPRAGAYRVERVDGRVRETPLLARYLGPPGGP